ncbi:MAG: protein-methionine-sulfoxide reductase heme-binding subunit MsrQ [Pseudomonadota bacterium]|nr:protein-methionine-sulfoxide reductase heme-binding subunit MsrQ [Pseudomonadota bacterium]
MPPRQFSLLKTLLFLLCLGPLIGLAYGLATDGLGANPIEALTRGLGDWTLRFLLITLAVTPLRRLTGLNWLARLRRMLGLYAFFYALLHFTSYVWLEQFFDWAAIWKDIVKRPFISVGFASFLLLIPLAATSTNAMIKRLGGKRWQTLHRAVYAIAVFAVLHFWWMVKKDITQPAIYAAVLALLLGVRLYWVMQSRWMGGAGRRG